MERDVCGRSLMQSSQFLVKVGGLELHVPRFLDAVVRFLLVICCN